jgi:long-chain acyl-CoA synthetase
MHDFPSILHAVADHAKTIPDKIAIIEAETDRKCTYGELWAYVKTFSKHMTAAGVKRDFGDGYGTRVVVRCTQTIDFVVSALAIQLAGGVFVPVEKNIAEAQIIETMKETDSKILITEKPLSSYDYVYIKLMDAVSECDCIDDENIVFPEQDALADILFTTGTTGKNKGIMHSFKSFTAMIFSIYSAFNHDNEQIWLLPNPLSHINGFLRVYMSLFYQCTVVLLDGYALAKSFFSAIIKYKITIINLLSATTEMYLRTYYNKLVEIKGQINYISLAGSSFSDEQINSLRNIFYKSKIILAYGATEVGGCYIDHSLQGFTSFCIGQPRSGTKVVFFDEKKRNIIEATAKNPGLFAMNSCTRMIGYWKNPELTASVTRGDYIVLSDLGYKGEDGLLYFVGRVDDVITTGAYKIAPLEIEGAANSFDGIRESACVPVNDPFMGQVPKLFVVMNENHYFDEKEIINYLKSKMEVTKLPRYIEEIGEIPKINNKINRKALKKDVKDR